MNSYNLKTYRLILNSEVDANHFCVNLKNENVLLKCEGSIIDITFNDQDFDLIEFLKNENFDLEVWRLVFKKRERVN